MTGRVFNPTDWAIEAAIKEERQRIIAAISKQAWTSFDPDTRSDEFPDADVIDIDTATRIINGADK